VTKLGRVSGAGSLQKHCTARAKRQLSKSTRVVIQPTMIVRAIFGEGPLLAAQSGHCGVFVRLDWLPLAGFSSNFSLMDCIFNSVGWMAACTTCAPRDRKI